MRWTSHIVCADVEAGIVHAWNPLGLDFTQGCLNICKGCEECLLASTQGMAWILLDIFKITPAEGDQRSVAFS